MMKLFILAILGLAQVISGQDSCGSKIQKMEVCIQTSMLPSTTSLKRGLTSCFRPRSGNGCIRKPRLTFVEDEDGNAVTECLNQGLKSKGGPIIEKCMRKKFSGWRYPTPPGTFVPGSPEAIIRVALNQLEDPKICPPRVVKSVQSCIDKVIKKTVPTPTASQAKRNFCQAKAKCTRGMSSSCLNSMSERSVRECKCASQLASRYQPAADRATVKCLTEYMPANQAQKFIKEVQDARKQEKVQCRAPPQDDC